MATGTARDRLAVEYLPARHFEAVDAYRVPAGTALEFIGMNGRAVRREAQVTVFVKRPPREALVCGIGTWQQPAAQLGALVLRQRHADRRSILGAGVVPTLGSSNRGVLTQAARAAPFFGTAAGPWSSPKRAGAALFRGSPGVLNRGLAAASFCPWRGRQTASMSGCQSARSPLGGHASALAGVVVDNVGMSLRWPLRRRDTVWSSGPAAALSSG